MSAIGFDPGTANLVVSWGDGAKPKIARLRNVFLEVPVSDFTKRMLRTLKVPQFESGNKTFIAGNYAFELAQTFGKELRRPMRSGVISADEADAIPLLTLMIGRLLQDAGIKEGTKCAYSTPADPVDEPFDAVFHRSVIEGILKKFGLEPRPVLEGHSIVLAELVEDNFTGIGISFGGGMANLCVAFQSVPVISFSTTKAGDWIDEKAAQVCGVAKPRMTAIKESNDFSLVGETSRRDFAALRSYYHSMIQYTLENAKRRLEEGKDMPQFSEPITIVLAGGTACATGFVDMFRNIFEKMDFPVKVKEVRLAADALFTNAKGLLVAASL